jgi:small-conductance mechanosensitive channel
MGPTWWAWGAILAIALASLVTGWVVARLAYCLMRRADAAMGRRLRDDTGSALTSVLGLAIFVNAVPALVAPTGPVSGQVDAIGIVLLYVAMVWLAAKILWSVGEALSDRYVRRLQDPGNLHARRMRTKISVGRRLLIVLALVFGIGVTLMQLDLFGAIGLSLLASAGAVTVLVSIAARPFLENMLAGIQIALTEPVRIGDTVVIDGRWGTVETIAFTYVTVLTWDFKRLVVPHRHLLGEPFENWSKKDEAVKIPVSLKVDPALDIALLRRRYEEVIDADPRWHGEDRRLEVMEVGEEAVEVRAIASGASAADAWNLHVSLREALLGFLQTHEGGRYLVHRRHRLAEAAREALAASGGDGRGDREAAGEDEAAEARHAH